MKAIPKITVRIDGGKDWVELSGDWQGAFPLICGEGDVDWVDYELLHEAWDKLNEAVME